MQPLYGPRERVKRANRQIVALQRSFRRFFRSHVYKIGVAKDNRKPDHYSLRVIAGPEEFPIDWSLCIGEIAHNLRAALDGLTWEIATIEPRYGRTAFPISLSGKDVIIWNDRKLQPFWHKSVAPRVLQSIPRTPVDLWAQIESFQPYKGRHLRRRNPLFRLEELNNSDKHRLVALLTTVPAEMSFSGLAGEVRFYQRVPLRMKAKIGWVCDVPPNVPGRGGVYTLDISGWKPGMGPMEGVRLVDAKMEVNVTVGPSVSFGDTCKAVRRLPVIRTLQGMANEVSRVIEAFV